MKQFWISMVFAGVLAGCSTSQTVSPEWKQMPLRTDAMAEAGLFGGDGFQQVYGFSYAPSDPQRVYCVIDCARVWRSDDGGSSWYQPENKNLLANGGMDLAVDPVDPDTVFIAGSQGRYVSKEVDGVYRTLDGGRSWERVLAAEFRKLPIRRGNSLLWLDPSSVRNGRAQTVYAAVQDGRGIFRSLDGGSSWEQLDLPDSGLIYDFQKNPFADEFWVSADTGLYILSPRGNRFSSERVVAAQRGLPSGADNAVSRIQFHTKNPQVVYALCGKAGFYKSVDGGSHFMPSNTGISPAVAGRKYAAMLDMNSVNPEWLILGHHAVGNGGYMSFDGGETWQPMANMDTGGLAKGLVGDDMDVNSFYVGHKAAFHPTDPNVALIPGAHWWMEKTVDGGRSWFFSGNGFTGGRVGVARSSFNFPTARTNEITLFCIDSGVFRSSNGGHSFSALVPIRVNGAKTTPVGAVHPHNGSIIICPSGHWDAQKLILTEDCGRSWRVVLEKESNFRFCAYHPENENIIYAGEFRSDDGGQSWTRLPYSIAAISPDDGDRVYAFESAGPSTEVYYSADRGDTWIQLGESVPASGTHEIAAASGGRVFVPAANGLNIWDGEAWTVRDEATGLSKDWFGAYNFRNVAVHPENSNLIFLSRLASRSGYTSGVLCSADGGISWTNISRSLWPEMAVWAMAVDPRTDRLYIGTSQGTWYLENVSDLADALPAEPEGDHAQ